MQSCAAPPHIGALESADTEGVADEKRDQERLTVVGDLFGDVMVPEPMLIREIGHSGATIETRFPLQLDSLHDLRLLLAERPVIVKGRVVHSYISDVDQDVVTYRSGVEFVEPSNHVIEAIDDYVENVKSARQFVARPPRGLPPETT